MLKHCEIEVLEKKQLDFWWELKNDAYLKRNYWGDLLKVHSKRELEKEIEGQIKSKEPVKQYHFLVKNKRGEYVGYIGLNRRYHMEPTLNATISVVPRKPAHLRSKALSEATDWVLAKCFHGLKLHAVAVSPLETNEPYIRFLEAKGFQHNGVTRRVTQLDGEFAGGVLMDLLEHEWRAAS